MYEQARKMQAEAADCDLRVALEVMRERAELLPISVESIAWLRQMLTDVLNDDFLGAYPREQVGPVPADLCVWADVDPVLFFEFEAGAA